jgi:sugar phosphate isomerase/epimerase
LGQSQPIACSTLAYAEHPPDVALASIAAAGYRYVEVAAMPGYCDHLVEPDEPEDRTIARARSLLDAYGLRLISLSAHIDLIPAPPGHLPAFSADQALNMLMSRVRIAGALGASVVNTQGVNPASPRDLDEFLARIAIVADEAVAAGVKLAIETADGLTASGASVHDLMTRLEGVPVHINYDTGNLPFYSGLDPVAEYPAMHDYVVHVHMKDHRGSPGDYDFPALGEGSLDLVGFARQLRQLGYDGPVSAEIEFQHPTARPPKAEIDRAVAVSRAWLEHHVLGVASGRVDLSAGSSVV